MGNLEMYRAAIERFLEKQAAIRYAHGDFHRELVLDRDRDRYVLLTTGWDGHKRVHDIVMQMDIIDGKIWIQENRTDMNITDDLIEAGVPAEHIVLGLLPPEIRQYSDFAVA